MTKVFIVILNWNRAKDTIECLNSVDKLHVSGYELKVITVDNGSTDDSIKSFKGLKTRHDSLEIIQNKKNLGFTGGNNVGIRHAVDKGADFILLLNNDTIVDRDLITGLLTTAAKKLRAALISPKIYFASGFEYHSKRYKRSDLGKVIWYAGGKIDWNNVYGVNLGVDEIDKGQFEKTQETDFATGACMFCRAEAFKNVGIFDENYFMYFEDADLSRRMKQAGWEVLYSPKGRLWHKVAQSSGIGSSLNDYYISRNRLLFGLKYAPLRTKFALIKESIKLLLNGRQWQKIGVRDFYLRRFGKGSWPPVRGASGSGEK